MSKIVCVHQWVQAGGWNIADIAARAYDLEGMDVGMRRAACSTAP